MKRTTTRSDAFNLTAVAATFTFVILVAAGAFYARQQALSSHDGAKPAHHMASLAQIQAVMKKAQDAQDDGNR